MLYSNYFSEFYGRETFWLVKNTLGKKGCFYKMFSQLEKYSLIVYRVGVYR